MNRHAEYREKNRDALRRRHAAWRAANPERWRAIQRKNYEKSRLALNAKQREKNKTPERKAFMAAYAKRHRDANPELYATYYQNRRARQLRANGAHTNEQWLEKVKVTGGQCVYCGEKRRLSRDHDIPLARGGSNSIDNIVPACGPCNSAKGTLTGDEFRQRRASDGPSQDPRWKTQLELARSRSPAGRGG